MTPTFLGKATVAAGVAGLLLAGVAVAQTTNPRPQQAARPAQPAAPAAQPAAPAAQAPAPGDNDVVAKVGQREVKVGELRAYLAGLGAREQAAVAADPAQLSQAVRNYLVNDMVLNAATARKWDQRPEVAARLEKARRDALVESFLDTLSQPPADYPPAAEIQALYDSNKTQFVTPRQFQVAQVFVAAPDKATEDKARARLDDYLARLKQPNADFAAVVRDGAGKEAGDRSDDIGWVAETQLRPEIREQVSGLAKGAMSAPLKLNDGWHILKLVDTKPAGTLPVEAVRDQLAQRLRQERATQLRRAVVQDLMRQSPAAINELALSRIMPAPGTTTPR